MGDKKLFINKLVSVIVPAYNAARFLKFTINSIIAQDHPLWELIIVDDGSTDNTEEIMQSYLSNNRVRYYKIKNGGVSNARNYGASLANGEYLCFLDSDDFFYPQNLSKKLKLLTDHPDIALVHSDVVMTDENGIATGELNIGLSGENLYTDILAWEHCVIPAPSSIMITKSAFLSAGKWDPDFSTAADQEFFLRVTKLFKIERIPENLSGYKVVANSMSRNIQLFAKDHMNVFNKAKINNMFPNAAFEKKCFSNLHLIIASNWWNENHKFFKALKHILLSLSFSPSPIISKIKKKFL